MKMTAGPVIQLQRDAGCRREWLVEWQGKRYRADSYPDSDRIYLETERGRRLSPLVARRLTPLLRQLIRGFTP